VGYYNGQAFEDREVHFPMGEGSEFGICGGLEQALGHFKKGEKSRIELKAKYAFGEAGEQSLNIPPGADVSYVVEMRNFEKVGN
jgi:FKBP-type peptidyl-prolyl cis-trans isomerase